MPDIFMDFFVPACAIVGGLLLACWVCWLWVMRWEPQWEENEPLRIETWTWPEQPATRNVQRELMDALDPRVDEWWKR